MISNEIRIVVVDDDPQMGRTLVRVLAQNGIAADYYSAPEEAIAVIENELIDLLITDYMMPRTNGLELLHMLKRQQPNALGMLITGINDFSLAVSAINEGSIVYFFTKPFNNEELINTVQHAMEKIREYRKVDALKALNFSILDKNESSALYEMIQQNAIEGLTELLKAKDEELFHHSVRVSKLCRRFGVHIGMDVIQQDQLESSALQHDIGKLAIKDQILDKPSKLNEDEYTNMKRHPQVGAELLKKLGVHTNIVNSVLHHHEAVDGGGYPTGLKGDEIVIEARIISIVDAYDALRSERSYKAGFDFETTQQMMFNLANRIYDKNLLEQFFELLTSK